jgi:nucleotide-binding universal stress UspA family protein
MYTIVSGVDQDRDRTTAQARAIVDLPVDPDRVEVVLIHNFTENRSGASVAQISGVRQARATLEDAGIDVILEEFSHEEPAEGVLELADEYDADLLVVAGRKRSPTRKALFGSVSQQVMLNTDLPVLVCSPE